MGLAARSSTNGCGTRRVKGRDCVRCVPARRRAGRAPDGQTGTTTVPLDQRQGPSSARVRFRLMDAASGSQADCREVWGRFQRDRGGKTAGKVEFDAAEAIEARL